MGTHMDGDYVRFYATGAQADVLMSTLFRDELNTLRPLRAGDVFYLCSLGWEGSAAFTGNIHAGAGAVATGEFVWVFDVNVSGNMDFSRPVPIHVPTLKTSGETVWGHGFIRSA